MKSAVCAFYDSYKGYEYLTNIELSVGDMVVVAAGGSPENFGYKVVMVTGTLEQATEEATQWILAKIEDREKEWL